jgi:hypothetical protein
MININSHDSEIILQTGTLFKVRFQNHLRQKCSHEDRSKKIETCKK